MQAGEWELSGGSDGGGAVFHPHDVGDCGGHFIESVGKGCGCDVKGAAEADFDGAGDAVASGTLEDNGESGGNGSDPGAAGGGVLYKSGYSS